MCRDRPKTLARLALALATIPGTSLSLARVDTNVAVDLAVGYDSNPLRLSVDGRGSPYTDLRLDAGVGWTLGSRSALLLSAEGAQRFHGSGQSGADAGTSQAEMRLALTPYRRGRSLFMISLGGRYGLYRATFLDPATGGVYQVPSVPATIPATLVPIPDRFDTNVASGFVDLRARIGDHVRLSLATTVESARSVQDYQAGTGLEPLDATTTIVEPGIRWQIASPVAIEVGYTWSHRSYDSLPALSASGSEVAGTTREYRSNGYRLAVHVEPTARWDVDMGAYALDRADTFAGYYDSNGATVYLGVGRDLGSKSRLTLLASRLALEYPNAPALNLPNGEIRPTEGARALTRFEHDLPRGFSLVVEAGAQQNDNPDPLFTYRRIWTQTGFRYAR